MIVGLTGSFAAGKSTVAGMLERRGARIIDADQLARAAVAPDQPALRELWEHFGGRILQADGSLDRGELGRIIFNDPARRELVERIIHPRVRAAELRLIEQYKREGARLIVLMVPLLFETGAESLVDKTLLVVCDETQLKKRAREREGLSDAEIELRLQAQMPQAEKRKRADGIIDNTGKLPETAKQLDEIMKRWNVEEFRMENYEL